MHIRLATADDIPVLMQLGSEAATAAQWSIEAYRRIFAPGQKPDSRRLCWVAEETDAPGSVQGFLVVHIVGKEWEVENVAVMAAARRRGIASSLLDYALSEGRKAAADAVFLEVRESNLPARRLYEKFGFAPAGGRKGYYSDPREDACVYRKIFPQQP